jgi:glutamate/tyrosine decarboxylase-like PLP-dependent enzyme
MAHFTCLAAARHGVLASSGWDVEKNGLNGAPPVRILTSRLLHATAVRAIRYLGFGTNAIEYLSSDKEGRLLPDALQTALKDNKQPAIVILQAGDVNTGAFDDFEALIEIAHERNAWVHIDGAFGLWAATSEQYKHLVKGCEKADSWAADGHKWLNVPYDSGYAFVRDSSAHFETFSIRASYLIHSDDARDQMDWTPEWSRRARGFATYAAIRELGKNGISEIVENCCRLARLLTEELGKIKGVEIVSHSKINQSLVRFIPAKKNPAAHEVDAFTDFVISENLKRGASFFGGTSWNGSRCMRISVSNWRTNQDDIAETVDVFKEIMDEYGVAG